MIRLDSQTGFQMAVSLKCNVVLFIVSMLHMLLSGGWLLLENGSLSGDHSFVTCLLLTYIRTSLLVNAHILG